MSQAETIGSFAAFARWLGVAKSRITELHQAERLALTPDGRRVRFEASKVRIAETESPAHDGVRARHAAAREAVAGQGTAQPSPPPGSAPNIGDGGQDRVGSSYQQSRAVRERFLALQAKLEYERNIGNLLDAAGVESALASAVTQLRGRLESLPVFLGPQVASESQESRCVALLREAVEEALSDLSRQFANIAKGESV